MTYGDFTRNSTYLKIAVLAIRQTLGVLAGLKVLRGYTWFIKDLRTYRSFPANPAFPVPNESIKPCLAERIADTPMEPTYIIQNAWCARKIFENRPKLHIDIGSQAVFVAMIAQFVETEMVDIRRVPLELPGLNFRFGSILELPYQDRSIESLSSMCVIEHIGLGRFCDELDPYGSEKSISELKRVLALGGNLYISVPVGPESKIAFNAHRIFTREQVIRLFEPLKLKEERYLDKKALLPEGTVPAQGIGLFNFTT